MTATVPVAAKTEPRRRVVNDREGEGSCGPAPSADLVSLRTAMRVEIEDGWSPIAAAGRVLDRYPPDSATARVLMVMGLARAANSDLGQARASAARPAAAVAILPPETGYSQDPLAIPAETPEGEMRPWSVWTVVDWRAWSSYCQSQVEGWSVRQEGSGAIAALLDKHHAERIADLAPVLQEKARAIVRGFRA